MKDKTTKMVELVKTEIDVAVVMERLKSPKNGAIASYFGSVRDTSKGKTVDRLIYPEEGSFQVLKKMEELRTRALNKFDIRDVVIVQRLGVLKPGDNILFAGISAAMREPAFDACRYLIDRIKTEVHSGWKKEFYGNEN